MSRKMSSRQRQLDDNLFRPGSWDEAISDAERMLREAQGRVKELAEAVRIFKRRRDSGEPFFGQQQKQSEAKG